MCLLYHIWIVGNVYVIKQDLLCVHIKGISNKHNVRLNGFNLLSIKMNIEIYNIDVPVNLGLLKFSDCIIYLQLEPKSYSGLKLLDCKCRFKIKKV